MYQAPPRWTGGARAALVSSLPGRAVRWGSRSDSGLEASLPSKLGLWRSSSKLSEYKLLSNCSSTKRFKSSVSKSRPCSPRWGRWTTVSPSGPWAVEEPAFLMAAATPLTLNSLYEGSTRWWRSLISLLNACDASNSAYCISTFLPVNSLCRAVDYNSKQRAVQAQSFTTKHFA